MNDEKSGSTLLHSLYEGGAGRTRHDTMRTEANRRWHEKSTLVVGDAWHGLSSSACDVQV